MKSGARRRLDIVGRGAGVGGTWGAGIGVGIAIVPFAPFFILSLPIGFLVGATIGLATGLAAGLMMAVADWRSERDGRGAVSPHAGQVLGALGTPAAALVTLVCQPRLGAAFLILGIIVAAGSAIGAALGPYVATGLTIAERRRAPTDDRRRHRALRRAAILIGGTALSVAWLGALLGWFSVDTPTPSNPAPPAYQVTDTGPCYTTSCV